MPSREPTMSRSTVSIICLGLGLILTQGSIWFQGQQIDSSVKTIQELNKTIQTQNDVLRGMQYTEQWQARRISIIQMRLEKLEGMECQEVQP